MVTVCILKLNLFVVSAFVSLHTIVVYRITATVQKYGIWLKNVKVYVLSKTEIVDFGTTATDPNDSSLVLHKFRPLLHYIKEKF